MTAAALDMALTPKGEELVRAESTVSIFERLARDPQVDVDKLERLMQLHERATARMAEEAFNRAMTAAQTEMRPVARDAENPQTRSKYASYGALDTALRPLYTKHGFGLSFDTGESPQPEWVRVLCYVSHDAGHARTYHADMPADGKGAKGGDVMTRTHAVGSAMSYGMRYLLKMIFNVAVGEFDDDGNAGRRGKANAPAPPDGYADWVTDLYSAAEEGTSAARAAWKASPETMRGYAERYEPGVIDGLKAKGKQADKKAGR